jgi:hypothetical protein
MNIWNTISVAATYQTLVNFRIAFNNIELLKLLQERGSRKQEEIISEALPSFVLQLQPAYCHLNPQGGGCACQLKSIQARVSRIRGILK